MITTCRTWLPPLKEYNKYLKRIWKSNILTNSGELVTEFEERLKDYLGVKHLFLVANGTIAEQIAIKALGLKGKFYTSPVSYVATVSAAVWEGLTPVYVDMGKDFKRGPVISTHVYGIPRLTDQHPVIYDGCHAFGVKYRGKSLLAQGDISFTSFHATKTFQSIEGGAIITSRDDLAEKIDWMRFHGHKAGKHKEERYTFHGVGINAKMSELHAAMGLCMLPKADMIWNKYQEHIQYYNSILGTEHKDMTYFPYMYESEFKLLRAIDRFEKNDIYPIRYFYPALNTIPLYKGKSCPVAEDFCRRVLCLPLFYKLTKAQIRRICDLV